MRKEKFNHLNSLAKELKETQRLQTEVNNARLKDLADINFQIIALITEIKGLQDFITPHEKSIQEIKQTQDYLKKEIQSWEQITHKMNLIERQLLDIMEKQKIQQAQIDKIHNQTIWQKIKQMLK